MSVKRERLPYRPCVGIVLLNRDRHIFVARRSDTAEAWQMPQGGIDPGEAPEQAARRELAEETGIRSVRTLAEARGWVRYDLPDHLLGKVWGGRYRGQEQKWFAMAFIGDEAEIDLDAHHREFDAWRWSPPDRVLAEIVPFKRDVYTQVLKEFAPLFG